MSVSYTHLDVYKRQVKSDKGEYILDNQTDDIVLWSDTGYRFVKRQSQSDPNVWVALGEPRSVPLTATAH